MRVLVLLLLLNVAALVAATTGGPNPQDVFLETAMRTWLSERDCPVLCDSSCDCIHASNSFCQTACNRCLTQGVPCGTKLFNSVPADASLPKGPSVAPAPTGDMKPLKDMDLNLRLDARTITPQIDNPGFIEPGEQQPLQGRVITLSKSSSNSNAMEGSTILQPLAMLEKNAAAATTDNKKSLAPNTVDTTGMKPLKDLDLQLPLDARTISPVIDDPQGFMEPGTAEPLRGKTMTLVTKLNSNGKDNEAIGVTNMQSANSLLLGGSFLESGAASHIRVPGHGLPHLTHSRFAQVPPPTQTRSSPTPITKLATLPVVRAAVTATPVINGTQYKRIMELYDQIRKILPVGTNPSFAPPVYPQTAQAQYQYQYQYPSSAPAASATSYPSYAYSYDQAQQAQQTQQPLSYWPQQMPSSPYPYALPPSQSPPIIIDASGGAYGFCCNQLYPDPFARDLHYMMGTTSTLFSPSLPGAAASIPNYALPTVGPDLLAQQQQQQFGLQFGGLPSLSSNTNGAALSSLLPLTDAARDFRLQQIIHRLEELVSWVKLNKASFPLENRTDTLIKISGFLKNAVKEARKTVL